MRNSEGFDRGLHAAQRWRRLRRWALLLAALALLVEGWGLPYLRWDYTERHGQILSARYIGLGGLRPIKAGEVDPSCPLIVLVPLERSLVAYAAEAVERLKEE